MGMECRTGRNAKGRAHMTKLPKEAQQHVTHKYGEQDGQKLSNLQVGDITSLQPTSKQLSCKVPCRVSPKMGRPTHCNRMTWKHLVAGRQLGEYQESARHTRYLLYRSLENMQDASKSESVFHLITFTQPDRDTDPMREQQSTVAVNETSRLHKHQEAPPAPDLPPIQADCREEAPPIPHPSAEKAEHAVPTPEPAHSLTATADTEKPVHGQWPTRHPQTMDERSTLTKHDAHPAPKDDGI
ncbi:hypothetical protein PR048_018651 [Dryococelus australis]|uniref:Uncharacterized protein n=1 Tax=Dryococelus australis TaxID=614101 RepID=A0ABQ9HCY1_9NEOP|nr:hypothetical protein PR048_018651 [Dryococelus australis]